MSCCDEMLDDREERFDVPGRWISMIFRHSRILLDKEFESNPEISHGVSSANYMFLAALLFGGDGVSQDDLSKCMAMDKGTTARAVKKLEEVGLVSRETSSTDRRVTKVFLTDAGRAMQMPLEKGFEHCHKKLTAGFSPPELGQLNGYLKRIIRNLFTD